MTTKVILGETSTPKTSERLANSIEALIPGLRGGILMRPVESSNVESIGHAVDTLRVKYKNGDTYEYAGVTAAEFAEAEKSPSVGRYLAANIKPFHAARKLEKANA
jgi:hypothetical protein